MKALFVIVGMLFLIACNKSNPVSTATTDEYQAILERTKLKKDIRDGPSIIAAAIKRFQANFGRPPQDLVELLDRGYLKNIPPHPQGYAYSYNPELGNVNLARRHPFAPTVDPYGKPVNQLQPTYKRRPGIDTYNPALSKQVLPDKNIATLTPNSQFEFGPANLDL